MESGAMALFPSALFLFAENSVAATPCCRINLSVSLAEHEGVLVGLDGRVGSKTIGRGGRPLFVGNAVLSKKICGDGVCAFRRLSETSQKWRSHQSSGST